MDSHGESAWRRRTLSGCASCSAQSLQREIDCCCFDGGVHTGNQAGVIAHILNDLSAHTTGTQADAWTQLGDGSGSFRAPSTRAVASCGPDALGTAAVAFNGSMYMFGGSREPVLIKEWVLRRRIRLWPTAIRWFQRGKIFCSNQYDC